jgi:pimeloyl-ACP methyl ester carboxylesterase
MNIMAGLRVRTYGTSGAAVIVLHGGPAAVGCPGPMARALGDSFHVLEPWQRGSGDVPLTVARHMADLHALIQTFCPEEKPALVGESWGAMLALAFAAAHPECIGPIALVGCGTFDEASRLRCAETRTRRIDDYLRGRPELAADLMLSPDERCMKWHEAADTYHRVPYVPGADPEVEREPFDMRAHLETWRDWMRCRNEGLYPAAFAAITSPVLMLHGDYDTHPGPMTRDVLSRYIPHLEYREFARCGHSPWVETYARLEFLAVLSAWLLKPK